MSTSYSYTLNEVKNTPHVNVEPIVIEDEPKLKIRLLPKREKKKTIPDEPNQKKSESLVQEQITTSVFSDSEICEIIDEINNTCHENVEPIVIEDEPKLKIRLLPKREKRKMVTTNEPNQKKKNILLEGSAQEANTITMFNSSKKDDCIIQIIDDEPSDEPKNNIQFSSNPIDRKSISQSKTISHNIDIFANICENTTNIGTIEGNKPKIKILQNLVIRDPCKELDVLENVSNSNKPKTEAVEILEDNCNSINENDGFQIVIDEEPTIKMKLLPREKQIRTVSDTKTDILLHKEIKSIENRKQVLEHEKTNDSLYDKNRFVSISDFTNEIHWEDSCNTKGLEFFKSHYENQWDVSVNEAGNVEKSESLEVRNKGILEAPLNMSLVHETDNVTHKSCGELNFIENDDLALIKENKDKLENINKNDWSLQMIVTDEESKIKVKRKEKPSEVFETNETTNATMEKNCNENVVEDHSKSLLDSFLAIQAQYSILTNILPEFPGDCAIQNDSIETNESTEETTYKNQQMEKQSILDFETTVNDRHELYQEINERLKEEHFGTKEEENKKVSVYPIDTFGTTLNGSNIDDKLDDKITIDSMQTKRHFYSVVQSPCHELESVENNDPWIQERTESEDTADLVHNKNKKENSKSDLPSNVIVIDEEPKIKINFLSRGKKTSKKSRKNEDLIEDSSLDSFDDTQDQSSSRCSEPYLDQNVATNLKGDTNDKETKLGKAKLDLTSDMIVIDEEQKIKISFLSKRKKK